MRTTTLFAAITLTLTALQPVADAQTTQPAYQYREQHSLNLSNLPQPPVYNTNRTYTILSTSPELIQMPTCLAPGFALNFDAYLAEIAVLKSYVLAQVQSAMQAAPLLVMESLFPELASIVKHLNNMAWLKLSLQTDSCQQLVNRVKDQGLIIGDRPYAVCLARKLAVSGTTRDQAELQCEDQIGLVLDWKGIPRANINLVEQAFAMANDESRRNAQSAILDTQTQSDIQVLYPAIGLTAAGPTVVPNAPTLNYYLQLRTRIARDFETLIQQCTLQLERAGNCAFDARTVNTTATPTLFFPFPAEDERHRTPIIDLSVIEPLASVTPEDKAQLLDPIIHEIAINRLTYLAATGAPLLLASADATQEEPARITVQRVNKQVMDDIALVDQQFRIRGELYQRMNSLANQVRNAIATRAATRAAGQLQPVPGATARPFTGRQ